MDNKNEFNKLFDFIDLAQKNRKYAPNTSTTFRTPLRLIEAELSDEEKESLDLLKERLDAIVSNIYGKNKTSLSAASLEVYKRRILNVISDYEKYGKDPAKMASWNRVIALRKSKKNKEVEEGSNQKYTTLNERITEGSSQLRPMTRFELQLSPEDKAIILTPPRLKKNYIKKIKGYIDFLETSLVEEDPGGA